MEKKKSLKKYKIFIISDDGEEIANRIMSDVGRGVTGINVSWTQITGATSYLVYRREVVNGKWSGWKNMGTAKSDKSAWTDKSVKSGTQYKYTVRTVNGKTLSSYADGIAVSR